ncbi:MAG: hypothetical protein LBR64_05050, partial [Dysgonamonadaceae bacterium]|nr:hypothetical protein [Dysgonamonadaceae bacterium]
MLNKFYSFITKRKPEAGSAHNLSGWSVCMYVCIVLLFADSARAQVTIGALDEPMKGATLDLNPKSAANLGGLLFPNVFITSADSLPASLPGSFTPAEQDYFLDLQGMVVYNTNSALAGGVGLFVWDGGKWEKTGADASFATSCPADAISPAGGSVTCSISDPACTSGGEYSFSFIAGAEYAQLEILDANAGQFTLTIDANDRASSRSVILLVTSPCGKSQTFVYTQDGDTSGCNPSTTAPKIKGENTTDLCSGGAAYLYLDGRPTGTYIWTRNGIQVATGTDYVATQSGRYIVYADKIGCTTVKPDTLVITVGSTAAPAAVTISATNNGMVCGATETAAITATAPATGTLEWFKEGIRQTGLSGQTTINADLGKWFAAVTDGGCSSQKSNEITVSVSPSAGIALPDYTISGPNKVDAGDTKIYFATTANSQEGVNYLWTVTPGTTGATVLGSTTSNIVQVHFPLSGVAAINLNVSNDCETATVTNNDMDVVVGCTPASIYSYSPDSKTINALEGISTKLSITATG